MNTLNPVLATAVLEQIAADADRHQLTAARARGPLSALRARTRARRGAPRPASPPPRLPAPGRGA